MCAKTRDYPQEPSAWSNGMTAAAATHSRRSFPENWHAAEPPSRRRSRRRRIDRPGPGPRRFELEAAILMRSSVSAGGDFLFRLCLLGENDDYITFPQQRDVSGRV
jgi:hypothetical protein